MLIPFIMKYKENLRQKLDQLDNIIMRLSYQIGRNVAVIEQEETLVNLKEILQDSKALIELEEDDYKPRF